MTLAPRGVAKMYSSWIKNLAVIALLPVVLVLSGCGTSPTLSVIPPSALPPTVTVMVTLAPTAIPVAFVTRLQVIVVVPLHEPWLGVAETKVRPLASVSVKVTVVPGTLPDEGMIAGPLFVTVIV